MSTTRSAVTLRPSPGHRIARFTAPSVVALVMVAGCSAGHSSMLAIPSVNLGPVERVWWDAPTQPSPGPMSTAPTSTHQVTVTLAGDVLFEPDSAALTAGAATQLDVVRSRYLEPDPAATLVIRGFTNPDGGPFSTAQNLSQARADAIKTWLVTNGVTAANIAAIGLGDQQPKFPPDTPEHQAANRRCELTITTSAT
jgi:outer membrane protein OmpA-like peptidoglycan-associated protein